MFDLISFIVNLLKTEKPLKEIEKRRIDKRIARYIKLCRIGYIILICAIVGIIYLFKLQNFTWLFNLVPLLSALSLLWKKYNPFSKAFKERITQNEYKNFDAEGLAQDKEDLARLKNRYETLKRQRASDLKH